MQIFSEEWFNKMIEKLKADEEFQKKGKGFDSFFQFKVLKDPKLKINKDIGFGMWFPSCEPCWYGVRPDAENDIILEAKAGLLAEILKGKKNVVMALTMGTLKLKKGQVTKLTGNLGAVNRFIKVAGTIS